MDTQDELKSVIYGSRHSSIQSDDDEFLELINVSTMHDQYMVDIWLAGYMVERRNPHALCELARATIFDNLNHCNCRTKSDCCDRILSEKIDQLEIPETEKVKLKKIAYSNVLRHARLYDNCLSWLMRTAYHG